MENDGSQEKLHSRRRGQISRGETVCISVENMKSAKAVSKNFFAEIFRIANVNDRRQRTVYELEELNRTPIDVQFYQEELTPVRTTKRTV